MLEDSVGKSTHKVWLKYPDKEYEKPYLFPIGGLRGDIITLAKSDNGETQIQKKYRIPDNLEKNLYLETTLEDIKNLNKTKCIRINTLEEKDGFLIVDIILNEPRCSYYVWGKSDLINNERQRENLNRFRQYPVIDKNKTYQCRIVMLGKQVYLKWDNSLHWLYGFKNNDKSSRYNLTKILLGATDITHQAKELESKGIKFPPKRLKEIMTKAFLRDTLKKRFMLSTGPDNIGIRSRVDIIGEDLIKIIREQLQYYVKETSRHRLQKMEHDIEKAKKNLLRKI